MSFDYKNILLETSASNSRVAGVHLSGANARKSAVVLLEVTNNNIAFLSLYEKIGSMGSLFSDDRILDILNHHQGVATVMVDCPATEPPCVACTRATCPGAVRCEDVSVAMMMAIEHRRGRRGAHKLRPLNPQNQRLWDVMYARGGSWGNLEPSYSANLAPLVVRARTLQRRLRSLYPEMKLRETHIPILLSQLATLFDRGAWANEFRNFENGRAIRDEIVGFLAQSAHLPLRIEISQDARQSISQTVETFQAFLAAAMAAWRHVGLASTPTPFFEEQNEGWVDVLQCEHIL